MTKREKIYLYRNEISRDSDHRRSVYRQQLEAPKSFLNFPAQKSSPRSATSVLSQQPKRTTNNTTASLDILTCTDYVDFGKCQDRFGQLYWSQKGSSNLDVKLKVFKKNDKRDFRLVRNLTMGEGDFSQFMRFRNHLVFETESFGGDENLSAVLIPTMSKDMDEKLKLAHKFVDVVNCPCRKIFLTLLRFNMDKPESHKLKSEYLQGRRRTRSFSKLSM